MTGCQRGPAAGHFFAVNLAVLLVASRGPGLETGRPLQKTGLRPSRTGSEEGQWQPVSCLWPEKQAQGGLPEEQGAGVTEAFLGINSIQDQRKTKGATQSFRRIWGWAVSSDSTLTL